MTNFEWFHRYTMIGGMPEIVKQYAENKDVPALKTLYESLLTSYLDDADKYACNPTMRRVLRHCLESVPFEGGKRIKFQGFGNSNYRSREAGEALRTIERAILVYLIYPSTSLQLPIVADQKKPPKLQFVDTGLLNYFAGLQPVFFQYADLHMPFVFMRAASRSLNRKRPKGNPTNCLTCPTFLPGEFMTIWVC